MSTEQTWQTESTGLEATLALAEQIGSRLKGGEVVELRSDLGGGKTAFARGLAKGAGSSDNVHSPSFTLSNQYQAGDLVLHHFDFYRLSEPGILRAELEEILQDKQNVVIIEWGDVVEDVLPASRLIIDIKAKSENERFLKLSYPPALAYLIPNNT